MTVGMTATDVRTPAATAVEAVDVERLSRDAIAGSALFGAANVVMQLARLPVGRGVAESTVETGRVDKHPFKRQRTTASYLIVALLGTDEERRAMKSEVNRSHSAVVRSEEESDVAYSAFDPELQLWVAACIYVGFSVWLELARGPLTDAERDAFYRHCSKLATTLQVPEDAWPADRDAFQAYWWDAVRDIEMDDVSRGYLSDLANLRFFKPWVQRAFGSWNRFLTVGFLAPEFRAELGEPWTTRDQRRFDRFLRIAIRIDKALPDRIRFALLDFYERDVKSRIAARKRIV
jgi:uncharacterized protein (DUF2236 family)